MIVFRSKGLIDTRAVTTFGVSSKESDNPIGQFGTGLKYAIAIILREGGSIALFRGKKRYDFTVKRSKIRVDRFNLVVMNGRELAFTTALGTGWESWQAYREIHSNTLDEGGTIFAADEEVSGEVGFTKVAVTGADFEKHFKERDRIFLATTPMLSLQDVEVHPGESEHIYYRGIRVMKLNKKSLYTYNLTGYTTLTEDRTVKYPILIPGVIAKAVVRSSGPAFLNDVLTAKDAFEASLDWGDATSTTPSDIFMTVVSDLRAQKKLANRAAINLFNSYTDKIVGYTSAYMVAITAVEESVITRARARLDAVGIGTDQFQIAVKSTLGGDLPVQTQGHVITLAHHVILKGDEVVARALLHAVARSFGGMVEDQLANFILHGEMRKTDQETADVPDDLEMAA